MRAKVRETGGRSAFPCWCQEYVASCLVSLIVLTAYFPGNLIAIATAVAFVVFFRLVTTPYR